MPTLEAILDSRKYVKGSQDVNKANKEVQKGTNRTSDELGRYQKTVTGAGVASTTASTQMLRLAKSVSALLVIRQVVRTIADFESTMATVRGVTGASAAEFDKLSIAARKMGATTRFSASQAAEAQLFLARAGFSVQDSIDALPSTLALASAGAIELGQAADIASNVLSQFNLTATETGRVGDVLVATSNASNTNILQLAEAMQKVGPVAGSLNISVERTAAAIGVLGDNGIQASIAGTNLRGILLTLINPTGQATEALKEMGLTLDDIDPQKKGLVGAFKALNDAQLDSTRAAQLFGNRNTAAALILSQSIEKLDKLNELNVKSAGNMEKLAAIQNNTLTGAFKSLRSVIEEVFIKTGDKGLAGSLKSLVVVTTDVIRFMVGMEDSIVTNRDTIERLVNTVKSLAAGFGTLVVISSITKLVVGLTTAFKVLRVVLATHPITALAVVLVTVTTALIGASSAAESFSGAMNQATDAVRQHKAQLDNLDAAIELATRHQFRFNEAVKNENLPNATRALRDHLNALSKIREDVAVGPDIVGGDSAGRVQSILRTIDPPKFAGVNFQGPKEDLVGIIDATIRKHKERLAILEKEEQATKRINALNIERTTNFNASASDIQDAKKSLAATEELVKINNLIAEMTEARKDQLEEEAELRSNATKQFTGLLEQARAEHSLIGLSNTERSKAIKLREANQILIRAGSKDRVKLLGVLEAQIDATNDLRKTEFKQAQDARRIAREEERQRRQNIRELLDNMITLEDFGNRIRTSFSNTFTDFILGAKEARDVVKSLLNEIATAIIKQNISNPIAGALGAGAKSVFGSFFPTTASVNAAPDAISSPTIPNALGNAFGAGGITAFANGGIVSNPTLFGFNGGTGLMGEAGPEAILPLKRGSGGRLGVDAAGNVTVNVINQTGNNVETKRKEANGNIEIDVIITSTVTRDLRSNGPISQALQETRGVQTLGTGV